MRHTLIVCGEYDECKVSKVSEEIVVSVDGGRVSENSAKDGRLHKTLHKSRAT